MLKLPTSLRIIWADTCKIWAHIRSGLPKPITFISKLNMLLLMLLLFTTDHQPSPPPPHVNPLTVLKELSHTPIPLLSTLLPYKWLPHPHSSSLVYLSAHLT